MTDEIVYFELNNWSTEYFPDDEPFLNWMGLICDGKGEVIEEKDEIFFYDEWVKDNKLCILCDIIDMSFNFCITATKDWVLNNCPKLLTDHNKYLRYPNEEGKVLGRFSHIFLEYKEENIGIQFL